MDSDGKSLKTGDVDPDSRKLYYEIKEVPVNTKQVIVKVVSINNELWETDEDVKLELVDSTYQPSKGGYEYYRVGINKRATLTIQDNEPIVSLGKVVSPQEGFGYGSTIEELGSAIELNGSSYINIANNDKLNLSKTGEFTQEAWIFASVNDDNKRGILGYSSKSNDAYAYPSIWQVNKTGIEVGFGDGKNFQGFTVPNVLNQNTWNHIATTFDKEKYRLYVNGVEVYSDESFKGRQIAPTNTINIGKASQTNIYTAIFSITSNHPVFNPTTVNIAGYDIAVKNVRASGSSNGYYFDLETNDKKIADAITNVKYNASQLIFNNNNSIAKIVWRSDVSQTVLTSNNNFFTGTIDEVRIWNIARSAGDIQDSMVAKLSGEETGLVGYWPFENSTKDATNNTVIGAEDKKTPADGILQSVAQYINNPAPQIGYIEVNLDKPFEGDQGLWVKYNINGSATKEKDYFNSRYRKVSTDSKSEQDGIIIAKGQTQGKIYLIAKPDQIEEPDENIKVELVPHNFDNEATSSNTNTNYQINPNSKDKVLTIKNNPAYKTGIVILDQYNRLINEKNPLYVDPNGKATLQVKLSGQPASNTTLSVAGVNITFPVLEWDQLKTVNLIGINANTPVTIKTSDNKISQSIVVTNIAPQLLQTTEGSMTDVVPVTPQVSIIQASHATEGNNQPGLFIVNFNSPAPATGLLVNYSLTGSAKQGDDYSTSDPTILPEKTVLVAPGANSAVIPITAIDDLEKESLENVKVTLKTGNGYTLDPNNQKQSATLNIIDNEQVAIQVVNASVTNDPVTNTTIRLVGK